MNRSRQFFEFALYGHMTIVKSASPQAPPDISMSGVPGDYRPITDGANWAASESTARLQKAWSGPTRQRRCHVRARELMQRLGLHRSRFERKAGMPQCRRHRRFAALIPPLRSGALAGGRFSQHWRRYRAAEGLDPDLLTLVATARERAEIENSPFKADCSFAIRSCLQESTRSTHISRPS